MIKQLPTPALSYDAPSLFGKSGIGPHFPYRLVNFPREILAGGELEINPEAYSMLNEYRLGELLTNQAGLTAILKMPIPQEATLVDANTAWLPLLPGNFCPLCLYEGIPDQPLQFAVKGLPAVSAGWFDAKRLGYNASRTLIPEVTLKREESQANLLDSLLFSVPFTIGTAKLENKPRFMELLRDEHYAPDLLRIMIESWDLLDERGKEPGIALVAGFEGMAYRPVTYEEAIVQAGFTKIFDTRQKVHGPERNREAYYQELQAVRDRATSYEHTKPRRLLRFNQKILEDSLREGPAGFSAGITRNVITMAGQVTTDILNVKPDQTADPFFLRDCLINPSIPAREVI
jgi:hypothetical protein